MFRNLSLAVVLLLLTPLLIHAADPLQVTLRKQTPVEAGSDRYHRLTHEESWQPTETAILLCDVWDSHTCVNAVKRLEQFVPRLNELVGQLREQGVTVIHSPSGCMDHYAEHPARLRATGLTIPQKLPEDINKWCYSIPAEEAATYPIDQTDGGNDDTPEEKAAWQKQLLAEGRNPKRPWVKEHPGIEIDPKRDYISDRGEEVWSLLQTKGIKNVMIAGVHTNMCVLGRPFGLRQLSRLGVNAVLIRDLTDTMYNPSQSPFVSHFTGTDLIVSHIERHVCPTLTSDQFLGDKPFRFAKDIRPHLVIVMAEDEYRTNTTLPPFALKQLGKDFRVSYVHASADDRNLIPGIEQLDDADVALISVRRRVLPTADMKHVKEFVASGKPVVGIRTASHAFYIKKAPPEGYDDWELFDPEVFGGNYHGHHKNNLKSMVRFDPDVKHPILKGIDQTAIFPQGWSLYEVSPLASGTTPLMYAQIPDLPEEPVTWTFKREGGGRSFYTSLGNVDDFEQPLFVQVFRNGIYWAAGLEVKTTAE